jgi:hypothetical protein
MPFSLMRRTHAVVLALAACCIPLAAAQNAAAQQRPRASYLGFDANNYPGDDALPTLKQKFSFAGYWLNNPPGAKANSWIGKRWLLSKYGFGFLVLFNGRLERELKSLSRAATLGSSDAAASADAASAEGFPGGTIIFLDQEEGGRMESDQMAYIVAWIDGVIAAGYRAGIYCSGMPASEGRGQFVVTANDILNRLGPRKATFFVYNDGCPPSDGCAYGHAPEPSQSGVAFASIWQFAQSPRRKEFTGRCAATYNRDGNCYAPGNAAPGAPLDLDSATSPDPSNGRRQVKRKANVSRDGVASTIGAGNWRDNKG